MARHDFKLYEYLTEEFRLFQNIILFTIFLIFTFCHSSSAQNRVLFPNQDFRTMDKHAASELAKLILQPSYRRSLVALPQPPLGKEELEIWRECLTLQQTKFGRDFLDAVPICANRRRCSEAQAARLTSINPETDFRECTSNNPTGGVSAGKILEESGIEQPIMCQSHSGAQPYSNWVAQNGDNGEHTEQDSDAQFYRDRAEEYLEREKIARSEGDLDAARKWKEARQIAENIAGLLDQTSSGDLSQGIRKHDSAVRQALVMDARVGRYRPLRRTNDPIPFEESRELPSCETINVIHECIEKFGNDFVDCLKRIDDPIYAITGGDCETYEGEDDARRIRCRNQNGQGEQVPDISLCGDVPVGPAGFACDWCGKGNPVASSSAASAFQCPGPTKDVTQTSFIETTVLGEYLLKLCGEGAPDLLCKREEW